MKAFVGNRKYWYSWEIENTDTQVLAIIDNSGFRGHKIFGKKENRLEEKALQEKRWAQREPRRKKSKAYRRGRDTVKYQEGWEKKEMKTSEVKEAEKKWTKTVRDGKHQRAWGAGSQAGVNWSHTMEVFSKPGRSAAAEGNSNTWWINVLSVVSKTGDCNHQKSWYPPSPD